MLQSTHCCEQALCTGPVAHAATPVLAEAAFEPGLVAEACSAVAAFKGAAVESLGLVATLAVWRYESSSRAMEKCPYEEQLAESCWSSTAVLWSVALLKNRLTMSKLLMTFAACKVFVAITFCCL